MLQQIDQLPTPPAALQVYTWRPARRENAEAIHQLLVDCEAADQRGAADSIDDRLRDFESQLTNVETDTLLALAPDGRVAAMGWLFSPPVGVDSFISFLWGEVHPQHRGRGLGDFVLTWMEARGRQILATRPDSLPHYLRTFFDDFLHDRAALHEQHDFFPQRYVFRMRRDLSQPIPDAPLPGSLRLENWSAGDDEQAMEACNEAFHDHWGYVPFNLLAWQTAFAKHPYFRSELSFLALDESSGSANPVAGLIMNQVNVEENAASGRLEGWIAELGVRRPWRKQGLATGLLCASLRAFRDAGLEYAGLSVDSENLTGALRLYERLGFTAVSRQIFYAKSV